MCSPSAHLVKSNYVTGTVSYCLVSLEHEVNPERDFLERCGMNKGLGAATA
jgi:hypothetical protein